MSDASSTALPERHPREISSRILVVLAVTALVVAVAAVGLSTWALLREPSSATSGYNDVQRADAKASACKAYDIVRRGVTLNTNQQAPGGPADVTGTLAVAANARVSLYDGGLYLLARVEPSTPPDLADAQSANSPTI